MVARKDGTNWATPLVGGPHETRPAYQRKRETVLQGDLESALALWDHMGPGGCT